MTLPFPVDLLPLLSPAILVALLGVLLRLLGLFESSDVLLAGRLRPVAGGGHEGRGWARLAEGWVPASSRRVGQVASPLVGQRRLFPSRLSDCHTNRASRLSE